MIKLVFGLALLALIAWLILRPKPPKAHRGPDERALIEARAVLGVGLSADADEIRAAHRRLINDAHPDRGGSPELFRRVNEARDVLLKERR